MVVPLYEYECSTCGRFEQIQKFADAPLTTCPTCGRDVQKLLSAPAFQFKGSGWYITDYARKSGGSDGKSEGSKPDGGATKADAAKSGSDSATTASSGSSATAASSSPAGK
jgi:putative FmdB family regulatory protein